MKEKKKEKRNKERKKETERKERNEEFVASHLWRKLVITRLSYPAEPVR